MIRILAVTRKSLGEDSRARQAMTENWVFCYLRSGTALLLFSADSSAAVEEFARGDICDRRRRGALTGAQMGHRRRQRRDLE